MTWGTDYSVYEAVCNDLKNEISVLFIGLGCDVASLLSYVKSNNVDISKLYTVELVCDGCTYEYIHSEYIKTIEIEHHSKVIDFTVRKKRDGWDPLYLYAKFENGDEHIIPFYNSIYGFAFSHYKRRSCYNCSFKGSNHPADIVVGDYWGCNAGMREFNENGVSIAFVQTRRGYELLNAIKNSEYRIFETNPNYALYHNPRYNSPHPYSLEWTDIDLEVKKNGLKAIKKASMNNYVSQRLKDEMKKKTVLWGTGNSFHRLAPSVISMVDPFCLVDYDEIISFLIWYNHH